MKRLRMSAAKDAMKISRVQAVVLAVALVVIGGGTRASAKTAASQVTVSPNPLIFQTTSTQTQNTILTNTGKTDVNLSTILISPTSAGFSQPGGLCIGTLHGGASCTLRVTFTLPADAAGPETASLAFTFSDNSQVTAALQGDPGVASQVALSSAGLVFNNLSTSTPSAAQTITLTNTAARNSKITFTLTSIAFPSAAGFNQSGGTCAIGTSYGPGSSCTVGITFTDPTTLFGPLAAQPAIGPEKGTVKFLFSDGSFKGGTLRGNPGPMSGALLTIQSGGGVNLAVYDSQIHTGTVRPVPLGGNCVSSDTQFPTDAYVLQGGSWTGCDAGEAFEGTLADGHFSFTSQGFDIITHYQCAPVVNGACNAPPKCNTFGNICSSDSGFLTVTNNGTSSSGRITLSGGSSECGTRTDTKSSLAVGESVVLALAPDSSFCGGFEAQQTQPITVGQTTTFPFGNDDYQITPFNSNPGDQVTFLLVPQNSALFDPGPNYAGVSCIPYAGLSAPGNPVCAELQIGCIPGAATAGNPTGDCETYIYQSQADYKILTDQQIGGPGFLGVHHANCPPPTSSPFNLDTLFFAGGDCCTLVKTGSKDGSCHVATFKASAGSTAGVSLFVGFQSPVVDLPALNTVNAGRSVPLKWLQFDALNNPVTNLSLCTSLNPDDDSCAAPSGLPAPWVFVQAFQVTCPNGGTTTPLHPIPEGNSSLQNQSATTPGQYQFNWDTSATSPGQCAEVVFIYDSGLYFETPAEFQFK
jgi:hypothetical protein